MAFGNNKLIRVAASFEKYLKINSSGNKFCYCDHLNSVSI
jgi:hypothetical protein